MKSIPTIFVWDKATRTVINKPARGIEWIFQGKGVATRKYDGVAILVENGKVYVRLEWRTGDKVLNGFIKLQDPNPKKPDAAIPGWAPVDTRFLTKPVGPDEKALREAWNAKLQELTAKKLNFANKFVVSANIYAPAPELQPVTMLPDGTYELCGPKIRGNHEGLSSHVLFKHGDDVVKGVPRTFEKLKAFMETYEGEGIVWHDKTTGVVQMAKIKRRDFGFFTRITKEDLQMAYGTMTMPFEGKLSDGPIPIVHVPSIEGIFEADNSETGDDVHLAAAE